jgi:F-type H+-transporting ATPase subunit a
MLKLLAGLVFLLTSTNAQAAGYAFFVGIAEATGIGEHVLHLAFVCLMIFLVGVLYRGKVAKSPNAIIPDRGFTLKNMVEVFGQFVMDNCKAVIGEKEGPKYFNFCAMTFLLILCCNLIGVVPGFLPPTQNLNTTLALGAASFVYFNIQGCKEQGTWNYIKHFMGPILPLAVLIFPLEILSTAIRPISLALRLRGNMSGDHIVLGAAYDLFAPFLPIPFYILGLLVSCIQAYVFTMLTMVYISLAVAHHDHDEAHAH